MLLPNHDPSQLCVLGYEHVVSIGPGVSLRAYCSIHLPAIVKQCHCDSLSSALQQTIWIFNTKTSTTSIHFINIS